MSDSRLETELEWQIRAAKLPKPHREYHAIDGRRWRWDFAWPDHRLLLEVQGGIWRKGGHTTGEGITRDCEKLNAATLAGWRVLSVTAEHIRNGQALEMVESNLT
jgi:very-short-patch-repair endonuclease